MDAKKKREISQKKQKPLFLQRLEYVELSKVQNTVTLCESLEEPIKGVRFKVKKKRCEDGGWRCSVSVECCKLLLIFRRSILSFSRSRVCLCVVHSRSNSLDGLSSL